MVNITATCKAVNIAAGLFGTGHYVVTSNNTDFGVSCTAVTTTTTTSTASSLNTFRSLWTDPASSTWQAGLPGFLVQVMIVLVLTRILGKVLSYVRQPPVIGEIIAGIILGPSVLGYADGWTAHIFPAAGMSQFSLVANVGLIFFMFYLGLELDHQMLKTQVKTSFPIAIMSIAFPFAIGALASIWWFDVNGLPNVNRTGFILFCGTSMSFTAFPVLASILNHLNLLQKPIGVLAISVASVDDIVAWCVLAVASSFVQSDKAINGVYTFLLAIAYCTIMFFIIRPALRVAYQKYYNPGSSDADNRNFVVCIFLYLSASAFTCETMGIHAFFGSFFAGVLFPRKYELINSQSVDGLPVSGPAKVKYYCIPMGEASHHIHPDMPDFIEQIGPKIELIIVDFFLPMYFALSGIKTNIGSLNTGELWGDCIAIILIATLAKFLPAMLTTKFLAPSDPDTGARPTWKFAITMGFIMNTRGLVELIALNIGHDSGILSDRLFTMLVLMAIVTTVTTTPMMHYLYLKDHPQEQKKGNNDRSLMVMHSHRDAPQSSMFPPGLVLSAKDRMPSAHSTPRGPQPSSGPKTPHPIHATTASFDPTASVPASPTAAAALASQPAPAPAVALTATPPAHTPEQGEAPLLPRFHYDTTLHSTNGTNGHLPSGDAQPSIPSSSSAGVELAAIAVAPSSVAVEIQQ